MIQASDTSSFTAYGSSEKIARLAKHVSCSFTVSLKFYQCHFCDPVPSDGQFL